MRGILAVFFFVFWYRQTYSVRTAYFVCCCCCSVSPFRKDSPEKRGSALAASSSTTSRRAPESGYGGRDCGTSSGTNTVGIRTVQQQLCLGGNGEGRFSPKAPSATCTIGVAIFVVYSKTPPPSKKHNSWVQAWAGDATA